MSLPEKCSTCGCPNRATHLLDQEDPYPLPGNCRRVRDAVCEECGASYMRTNEVRRMRPVLLRNGSVLSVVPPRIRVRVQHEDEPDANKIDDWETEDTAAIRAGRRVPYVIEIIDGVGDVLVDVPNRIGAPGFEGIYQRPREILDAWLAYYAADHWTVCFGFEPGGLVYFGGEILSAVNYDQVDQDYGDIGSNTGFIICQSIGKSSRRFPVWVELLKIVKEITA